jgi:hypothetical protein
LKKEFQAATTGGAVVRDAESTQVSLEHFAAGGSVEAI